MVKEQNPVEGSFYVDNDGVVLFQDETTTTTVTEQSPNSNDREMEISDPLAIVLIGSLAVVGIGGSIWHSRTKPRNRSQK